MTRKQGMARIAEEQTAGATDLYPAYVRQEAHRPKRFIIAAPWSFEGGYPEWCGLVKKAFPEATSVWTRTYPWTKAQACLFAAILCFD
jgi:hypothetical protein